MHLICELSQQLHSRGNGHSIFTLGDSHTEYNGPQSVEMLFYCEGRQKVTTVTRQNADLDKGGLLGAKIAFINWWENIYL